MRALEIHADQLVEALLGGFEDVAPLALADAGVIDEQVEALEALARVGDERLAVDGGGDVAGEDVDAGVGAQALGGVATAAIRADHLVSAGELGRDGSSDAPARTRDDSVH